MTTHDPYLRPDTLESALDALASGGFRIAAGCTDLFPATERKTLAGPILDITAIPDLRGISRTGAGLRIGATTTWSDLIRADLPPALDGLKQAAREVGARQIQNRGTIAGNLCNASPAADGVPPLLTLEAQVELTSRSGRRLLALGDFILGPRRIAAREDELLTALHVPAAALTGRGAFLKLGARRHLVISIAMTAARIDMRDGLVAEAALAVGACGPVAVRLTAAERALIGKPLDAAAVTDALVAEALHPIDDFRADAGYRMAGAAEMMRRTIATLAPEAVA